MYRSETNAHWWLDIFLLTLFFCALFFIGLGDRPLFVPDEGRYAEIIREMITQKDYVTPHLNGIKYFEKPILFYWLGSAAVTLFGLKTASIRAVNALLALGVCLFTYITGRRLYDRATGLLAACILSTSTLFFAMAHLITLDLPVTVFITATFYFFLLGIQTPHRLYFYAATFAAACAVLTKGLIGIVFPIMIIGTWIALLNHWRLLKTFYLPSCLLLFLIITLPWHWLVQQRNLEFFHFYFIEQHFLRYTNKAIGHYQPSWFFIPYFLIGFFPWIIFFTAIIFSTDACFLAIIQATSNKYFFVFMGYAHFPIFFIF